MNLDSYLAGCRTKRFRPGAHDCAQFAARWIRARTGQPFLGEYRYRTVSAGMAALQRDGYADQVAYFAAHLAEVHPARAREGDIAVIETDDGPAMGICGGEVVYVAGLTELRMVPREAMVRAFRCPR